MTDHLPAVRRLRDEKGWGCRQIGAELGIGKDAALRLLKKLDLEDARRGTSLPAVIEIEPRTASEFAERIAACYRRSFDAVMETGRLLIRAKEKLPHGDFLKMIEGALPFTASTAQRLMKIAGDARLSNAAHVQHLPQEWGTLYELTKLSDVAIETGIASGRIRPDMERSEVPRLGPSRSMNRVEARDSLDNFWTPPWATRALCEIVLPQLFPIPSPDKSSVWEPACGEGHMSDVLEEYFSRVQATDIFPQGSHRCVYDFLGPDEPPFTCDWIITNPPFRGDMAERFVLRALELASVGIAMFVAIQFLETVSRYEHVFRDRPPTLISFFSERVNCCKGRWVPDGSTDAAYVWLVWVKGCAPMPPFWIPPGQRIALTKATDRARFAAWSMQEAAAE